MWTLLWVPQIIVEPARSGIVPLCQRSYDTAPPGFGWLRGGYAKLLQ